MAMNGMNQIASSSSHQKTLTMLKSPATIGNKVSLKVLKHEKISLEMSNACLEKKPISSHGNLSLWKDLRNLQFQFLLLRN